MSLGKSKILLCTCWRSGCVFPNLALFLPENPLLMEGSRAWVPVFLYQQKDEISPPFPKIIHTYIVQYISIICIHLKCILMLYVQWILCMCAITVSHIYVVHVYVCVCALIHICMFICVFVYMYMYICLCVCVHFIKLWGVRDVQDFQNISHSSQDLEINTALKSLWSSCWPHLRWAELVSMYRDCQNILKHNLRGLLLFTLVWTL